MSAGQETDGKGWGSQRVMPGVGLEGPPHGDPLAVAVEETTPMTRETAATKKPQADKTTEQCGALLDYDYIDQLARL